MGRASSPTAVNLARLSAFPGAPDDGARDEEYRAQVAHTLAIAEALAFHEAIGDERKAARDGTEGP